SFGSRGKCENFTILISALLVVGSDSIGDHFLYGAVYFVDLALLLPQFRRKLTLLLPNNRNQRLLGFFTFLQLCPGLSVLRDQPVLRHLLLLQALIQFLKLNGAALYLFPLLLPVIAVLLHILKALVGLQKVLGRQKEHDPALLGLAFIGSSDHLAVIRLQFLQLLF